MIKPKIGLGSLEAFFDGPAQARDGYESGQRGTGGNDRGLGGEADRIRDLRLASSFAQASGK